MKCLRFDIALVGLLAGVYYFAADFFIPFSEGRDVGTYFLYWQGLFQSKPPYPLLMLFRTPFTPAFFGVAYEIFGKIGAQALLCASYVAVSVLIYSVLRSYARWVGWVGVLLVFANLQLFEVFNSVASEGPQTILIVAWAWVAFCAMAKGSKKLGVALGLLTFLLVINRPANQLLIAACFLPLLGLLISQSPKITIHKRLVCSLLAFGLATGLTLAYMAYNDLRNGQFCIARLGGASIPFYRMFLQERLVRPDNGPSSAKLADLARRRVLPQETFQKYGIDERIFFQFTTSRMFDALFRASVEERGWDNDFQLFKDAAWECMRANPKEFWFCYIDGVYGMFKTRNGRLFRLSESSKRYKEFKTELESRYAMYREAGLQVPGEGDLLTATGWWLSAVPPENVTDKKNEIWFSPKKWDYQRRELPSERMEVMRGWSLKISPSWTQLAVGCLGTLVAFLRGRGDPRLFLIAGACMPVLLGTWFGVLLRYYRFPFDPVFTMFFCYGCYALWEARRAWIAKWVDIVSKKTGEQGNFTA
jgi:hypothetical protein